MEAYRTRYAPSPSGRMHLGHAMVAMIAWLRARSQGGQIVMRIDDLDRPRVVPGSAESILADHAWLGLDFDEGPLYQSDHQARYAEVLGALEAAGHLFECTCTRKELQEEASRAPHGAEPIYPGTCREAVSHPDRPAALRFRMREAIAFTDHYAHPYAQGTPVEPSDFVIRRADGLFAYQLAVVVDDHDEGIREVIRGEDLLSSTPRQLALYQAMGWSPPSWLHLPLLLDEHGARLSKRSHAVAIADLRAAGISAAQIFGWLACRLGLRDRVEPVTLEALLAEFSLASLRSHRPDARPLPPLVAPSVAPAQERR